LYTWAVGSNSLILPPEAGYRMSLNDSLSIQYLVLEVHYDNALGTPGRVDNSGVLIHFTEKLRTYDAGTLVFGNVATDEAPIPANSSYYRVEASCPSVCTSEWPHPIVVFADLLHMHQLGMMMWSTVHTNNTRVPGYFNRIEYYDFGFQSYVFMNRTLLPGDRINTVCVYNTQGKNGTRFGAASDQEMCLEFLSYYPRMIIDEREYMGCGSFYGRFRLNPITGQLEPYMNAQTRNYSTTCFGKFPPLDGNNLTLVNPDIPDPPGIDSNRSFAIDNLQCTPALDSSAIPTYVWIIVGVGGGVILIIISAALWINLTKAQDYTKIRDA